MSKKGKASKGHDKPVIHKPVSKAHPKPGKGVPDSKKAQPKVFQMGGQSEPIRMEDSPQARRLKAMAAIAAEAPEGAEVKLRTFRAPDMAEPAILGEAPEVKIAKPQKPIPSAKDKPGNAVTKPKWVPESVQKEKATGPKLRMGEAMVDTDVGGPVLVKNTTGKFSAELLGLSQGRAPVEEMPAPPSKPGKTQFTQATSNADDGLQVVAKQTQKFSLADLEMLKKAIVIKGSGIVNGFNLDAIRYDADGLIPVIVQERITGAVVQLAQANRDALEKTLTGNVMHYYNKQKQGVVVMDKASGRPQKLVSLTPDNSKGALLAIIEEEGPRGQWSDEGDKTLPGALGEVEKMLIERVRKGPPLPAMKDPVLAMKQLVEACKELVEAMKAKTAEVEMPGAAADVLQTLVLACRNKNVSIERVLRELRKKMPA